MDTFDPVRAYGSPQAAYSRIKAHVTLVGISSDWLFPPADVRSLGEQLRAAGVRLRLPRDRVLRTATTPSSPNRKNWRRSWRRTCNSNVMWL